MTTVCAECFAVSQLFTTKAQSLLLMTSVAMPVFSKKKETVSVDLNAHLFKNEVQHVTLTLFSWLSSYDGYVALS